MRAGALVLLGLAVGIWRASGDEKLPELKVGINTYSNVTVTTVTPTDIYFTHAGGMGNAKLKQLSPELQKHFGYDPAQAAEAEQKRATANARYRSQVASPPRPRPSAENQTAPATPAKSDGGLTWSTDFPAALNQARSENKMVLLDFTGSDWCGWCMKLDADVFSTPEFGAYAKGNLVLVTLDFPRRHPQNEALKQANQELKTRYRVNGFPTLVLLNSTGKELWRQVGYAEGGPNAFIAELKGADKR